MTTNPLRTARIAKNLSINAVGRETQAAGICSLRQYAAWEQHPDLPAFKIKEALNVIRKMKKAKISGYKIEGQYFETLQDAANLHGITRQAVHLRIKSANYRNWRKCLLDR